MTDFSTGLKKVLGATSVIVGTVIGAGYISGREIAEFFLTGDLAVSALCSFLLVLPALYFLLTNKLFEKGALKNVSEIFIFAGNLVMLGGMLSAADEVFSSLFSFFSKIPLISIATLVFCALTVKKGINGIEKVNNVLVPFMLLITLVLMTFEGGFTYIPVFEIRPLKIISYAGLNLFMSSSVFKKTGETLNKRQAFFASVLSATILFGLVFLIGLSLSGEAKLKTEPIPLLEKLSFSRGSRFIFTIVLYFGIVTTLLSENLAVFECVNKTIKSEKLRKTIKILICVTAFSLSRIGFYNIVSTLYPAVGIIGAIFILLSVLFRLLSRREQRRDTSMRQARKV